MKLKTVLRVATMTLFAALMGNTMCFGQSADFNAPRDKSARTTQGSSSNLFAEASSPDSAALAGTQTLVAASDDADSAAEPAAPAPKRPGEVIPSKIGIGVKVSTLGAGIEAAIPVAGKLNLRGGFNMFRYDRGLTNDGIMYAGKLQFQSAEAHLDYFPFGGFHVSPGLLFYNGNQLTATATVPSGQIFSIGGTSYESAPGTSVTGTGKLDFVKVSPSIMVGIGNLIPRSGRHFSFLFEVGGAYQGSARVALNLAGNVCDTSGLNCRAISSDPTVQANLASQQTKISNDLNPYRFFPIISLGVGFSF